MLVLGWTVNGTLGSSYEDMMGFGVSARGKAQSTPKSFTPPHIIQ